jgi:hypothetical protein
MSLSTTIKEKLGFRNIKIWLLSMFIKGKVDFKQWLSVTLSMFIKGKVDFRHFEIRLFLCLLKKNLTLDIVKCDIKYVCQKKSWL